MVDDHLYTYKCETNSSKTSHYTRGSGLLIVWVSEWLLFYATSAIFQLYHGENKLIFNENEGEVRFVLNEHA